MAFTALFALALFMAGRSALAQSGAPAPAGVEVARTPPGQPDTVAVYMEPERPVVGVVHFEVAVSRTDTGEPVRELQVRVYGNPPSGADRQTSRALDTADRPGIYAGNIEMDRAGTWSMSVDLVSTPDAPPVSLTFPVEVRARVRASTALGTLVWALITAAIVGGAGWLWWSSKRARRA